MSILFLLFLCILASCTLCHVVLRITSVFAIVMILVSKINFVPPTLE